MMGNMDWLRRNWPDLLIGIALVAVIAGIIATLISGGSFFPVGPGNRTANQGSSTQPAITSPAVTTPGSTSGAVTQPSDAGTTDTTGTTTPTTSTATTPQEPSSATTQSSSGSIAVLPPPGSPSAAQSEPSSATTPPSGPDTTTAAGTTGGTSQVTSTATTPTTSSSVTTPAATTPAASGPVTAAGPQAPYRVSVGAFGSLENANRQAETFRAAGYPVFLGTQGNLNIVLVGPFDTEEEARSVAARIRQDASLNVSDPTVYVLDSDDAGASSAAAGVTAPPSSSTAAPAASGDSASAAATATTTATPQATTPAGATAGRYLQVGAYGSRESSLPQRERVEDLGFVVSEREESGLIKLLIGPFDSAGLEQAQARLESAGIESFAR